MLVPDEPAPNPVQELPPTAPQPQVFALRIDNFRIFVLQELNNWRGAAYDPKLCKSKFYG